MFQEKNILNNIFGVIDEIYFTLVVSIITIDLLINYVIITPMENYTSKIIDLIKNEINENDPGLSVGVIREGKCLIKYSYGYQNLQNKVKCSSSTIYHLASLSKQFTALSILLLENRGLLSLDDKIINHLPELSDTYNKITIYQLIHHTSGIRDQWELLNLIGYDSSQNINNKQIIELLNKQKKLNFEPGNKVMYCSSSYTILAKIIEKLTNKSLNQFCYENFFKYSEMENTFFYDKFDLKTNDFAESYIYNDKKIKKSEVNFTTVGATGLKSTINDLINWEISIQNKNLKENDILLKSYDKGILNNLNEIVYGAGVIVSKYKGYDVYRHNGCDAGFRSHFLRFKNEDLSIVVLSNNGTIMAGQICNKIADVILAKENIKEFNSDKINKKTESHKLNIKDKSLLFINLENNMTREILEVDKKYFIITPDGNEHELILKSSTEFNFKKNENVKYILSESGLEEHLGTNISNYTLLNKSTNDNANIKGLYYSGELDINYEIDVIDDKTYLIRNGFPDRELLYFDKDKYVAKVSSGTKNIGILSLDITNNGLKVSTRDVKEIEFIKL